MSPARPEPENDCAGEDQEHFQKTDPSFSQKGCCLRATTTTVQLEKKNDGRESQEAWRQGELTGGKLLVLKKL
jgi:hypothetical protein